ncbi:hypothetical protein C8Q76DRAFT_722314 [Earliella scabrosa]|nr:hypothetical protein C8Q76DRAFT_722314 [Earliella scabrosa]
MSPTTPPPDCSARYAKLHALALAHAAPSSVDQLMSIRHPTATHAWAHNYLVSRNAGLQDVMDNAAFLAHLSSTGRYLEYSPSSDGPEKVHDIVVDEHTRRAVVHMSYFLKAKGSEEVVEQDMIWILRFTGEEDGEVLIKESVEFIDASASARVGTLVRSMHGELAENVRGGITLKE